MQHVLEEEADLDLSDDFSDTTELGRASEVSSLISPTSDTFDESMAPVRFPTRDCHEPCVPDRDSISMTFTRNAPEQSTILTVSHLSEQGLTRLVRNHAPAFETHL